MTIDTDNLAVLTDADLGALLAAGYQEQARRSALTEAVQQVTQTAQSYVDAGGDKTQLIDAVQAVTATPEQTYQPA